MKGEDDRRRSNKEEVIGEVCRNVGCSQRNVLDISGMCTKATE